MRSTLTVTLLVAIAVAMAVTTVEAGDISLSAGVNFTETALPVSMASRIEAYRDGRLLGCWFSSSGQLPMMVEGLSYNAYGDFPTLQSVHKVVLSPDHGRTEWLAEMVPGKGYCVNIPNLAPGSYGLEWGVTSRDKRNRFLLVIIPIRWSNDRTSNATNQVMVQYPPFGCESYTDQQWFASLRGFVSAQATLDPSFVAQQQMLNQQPQTSQVRTMTLEEPQPVSSIVKPAELRAEPRDILLTLIGNPIRELPVTLDRDLEIGDKLVFKRRECFVAEAIVTEIASDCIKARITRGSVRFGDEIFVGGK